MPSCESGCSWNNKVAHAVFDDFVQEQGKGAALENLRQDIKSWIRERKGESFHWMYRVQGNDLIAENGKTIRELNADLLTGKNSSLADDSYKEVAMLYDIPTLERAQELALRGEKIIIFPIHHKDKNGRIVAKHLNVWTQDEYDATIYHGSSINLGKNFAISEVTERIASVVKKEAEVSLHKTHQEHAFVLSVDKRRGEEISKKLTTSVVAPYPAHRSVLVARSPQSEILRPVEAPGLRRTNAFVHDIPSVREILKPVPERSPLAIIPEVSTSLRESVRVKHNEIQKIVAALAVVSETRVAIGSVPILVESLAMEVPKPMKPVEKSMMRHKKKEMKRMRKKESPVSVRRNIILRQEHGTKRVIEQKKKRIVEKKARKKLFVEKVARALFSKRTETPQVLHKEKKREKKQRRLLVKLLRLARRVNARERRITRVIENTRTQQPQKGVHREKVRLVDEPSQETRCAERMVTRKKKKEAVLKFSFAWMLLLLLDHPKSEKLHRELKKKTPDTSQPHEQKDSTPWVLFSIIWYLAMIREQGMIRHTSKKKKKRQSGIIFERNMSMPRVIHGMIWI